MENELPDEIDNYKESLIDSLAALAEYQIKQANSQNEDHSHAWRGTWDRPMHIDERKQHPFTIARMTDHNVRGRD